MTYLIQPGDSLSRIAAQYGTSVSLLVQANQAQYPSLASDPDSIQVGWTLAIPVSAVTTGPRTTGVSVPEMQEMEVLDAEESSGINPKVLIVMGALLAIAALYYFSQKKSGFAANPRRKAKRRHKTKRYSAKDQLLWALGASRKQIRAAKNRKGPKWRLQSLMFLKSEFTKGEALSWARKHNKRLTKIASQKNYWRLEQESSKSFTQMRTVRMGKGVMGVIGKPKRGTNWLYRKKPKARKAKR